MFIKNSFSLVALFSLGIMAAPAMADTIYDGGGPDRVNAYIADTSSFPTEVAVPFTFTPTGDYAITDAHWWGVCAGNSITCQSTNFLLSFYNDTGGLPGASIASRPVVSGNGTTIGTFSESSTGQTVASSFPEYAYSAVFSSVSLNAGNYWLGISRTGNMDGNIWFMETSGSGGHAFFDTSTNTWHGGSDNIAFNLTGTFTPPPPPTPTPTPTPEPATLALMGLGLAGLGMGKRRRIV